MWHIEKPELRPAKLDFTSSEQGVHDVTQLFSDDIQLINAIELVEWDEEEAQFLICEACGFSHCEPGDWVRVRRSDSMILLLPSFAYVWAERAEDRIEYSPPKYLRKRGIPYFDRLTYERLQLLNPEFPAFEQIRQMNIREATLLFHWTAPARVLGIPPEVRVNREIIAGASDGDLISRLEKIIQDHYDDTSTAFVRPLSESDRVVSIYVDDAALIDWKAFVVDGPEYRLLVDSRFVIIRDE